MEFLGNTTVALRNPPNVDQSGSFTRMSMHIKTQQSDALLAYVGAKFVPDRPGPTPVSITTQSLCNRKERN